MALGTDGTMTVGGIGADPGWVGRLVPDVISCARAGMAVSARTAEIAVTAPYGRGAYSFSMQIECLSHDGVTEIRNSRDELK